jgi:hypothetical protein
MHQFHIDTLVLNHRIIQLHRIHKLVLVGRRKIILQNIIVVESDEVVIANFFNRFAREVAQKDTKGFSVNLDGIRTVALLLQIMLETHNFMRLYVIQGFQKIGRTQMRSLVFHTF